MAAEPNAPWSRWDAPGFQYVSQNTAPPNRQFDTVQYTITNSSFGNNGINNNNNNIRYYDDGRLVDSRPNANDPAFIDCVYQSVNGGAQIVQQCYKDFGCCDHRCCEGSSWAEKYGWAVALIVIFCILVIIAFLIWLFVWLINRSRDKKQRRELLESPQGMSPAQSQVNIGGNGSYNGGPYNNGPYNSGPPPPSSMGGPPPSNQGMPGPYYQPYGSKPYQY
jgi:hypothetical protein